MKDINGNVLTIGQAAVVQNHIGVITAIDEANGIATISPPLPWIVTAAGNEIVGLTAPLSAVPELEQAQIEQEQKAQTATASSQLQ